MSGSSWRAITVVVDPLVKAQSALGKAAALAARCGASLTLLNTFALPQPPAGSTAYSPREIVEAAIRDRRRKLEKLAAGLRRKKLKVRCMVEWDFPQHEAIVRHVLAERPDLLVTGTTHHNRLARWILSNTDWELIRSCPCPVWLARGGALPRNPKLLVAVDPAHLQAASSRLDARLLAAARGLREHLGGSLGLVHADAPGDSQLAAVRLLARRHSVPAASCHVIPGDTVHVLPDVARKSKADILVLGAVSRSRLQQPFIGTTAERVIDRVECDLLVVKPAGYRSPVARRRPSLPR